MNVYVNQDIKDKFKSLDFRGKPFKKKDGKTYIRAKHRVLHVTMHYCFEDDFCYFYP